MGLIWSKPITVKNDSLILIKAKLPIAAQEYWNLYKIFKTELKKDGFSVSKNNKTLTWSVCYWHTINDETYEKIDGNDTYIVEFKKKYKFWAEQLKKIASTKIKNEDRKKYNLSSTEDL